jgi:hypothetical protein
MTHLITEGVQILDGVDLQDWVDGGGFCLQIGKDVLREPSHDVDKGVDGSNTLLEDGVCFQLESTTTKRSHSTYVLGRTSRSDGGQKVDCCVLCLPFLSRVRVVKLLYEGITSATDSAFDAKVH